MTDQEFYDGWRERIERLRNVSEMLPPWHVEPDLKRWKVGLGVGPNSDDALNLHMLEWQVWLRSLGPEELLRYQARYPEPPGWGLYRLTSQQGEPVPTDQGSAVYWDSMLKHYENCETRARKNKQN